MDAETVLFVGTQTMPGGSRGIYSYRWNPDTGELSGQELAAGVEMPTFLTVSPDGNHLYAVSETANFMGRNSGGVTAFEIDGTRLRKIGAATSGGAGPCHVATDRTGRIILCANYGGGSASSLRVEPSGALTPVVTHCHHGRGPNRERQEQPHAHQSTASLDNRYVLVTDLGLDCIHIYRLNADTGWLTSHDPPQWDARPGSGPRMLRLHPNGRWIYVICELEASISLLEWDAKAGRLAEAQKILLTPANYAGPLSTGCDLALTCDGRYVYVANRGYDMLFAYSIDQQNGHLTELNRIGSGGRIPRHLALDPTERFLLVANQESDNICVFARSRETGELSPMGRSYPISRPQCLVFA